MNPKQALPKDILAALQSLGFIDANSNVELNASRLTGGVSSDIWHLKLPSGEFCVKRALEQLKVEQLWRVPVDRNAYEVAWFEVAKNIIPQSIPTILAHDSDAGVFVMDYLAPESFTVWKQQLLNGTVDTTAAAQLGRVLAAMHGGTAFNESLQAQFDTDKLFYALRVEPFLLAAAARQPDVAAPLNALADELLGTKIALVHGDVSPKNILLGPEGPIILDAECAWYGDPAFDLAFCLNHLLLKCVPCLSIRAELLESYALLADSYLSELSWEAPAQLEGRAARLLPALMIARVDGKSPVEYLTSSKDIELVRRAAKSLLLEPVSNLQALSSAWEKEISSE